MCWLGVGVVTQRFPNLSLTPGFPRLNRPINLHRSIFRQLRDKAGTLTPSYPISSSLTNPRRQFNIIYSFTLKITLNWLVIVLNFNHSIRTPTSKNGPVLSSHLLRRSTYRSWCLCLGLLSTLCFSLVFLGASCSCIHIIHICVCGWKKIISFFISLNYSEGSDSFSA